MFLEKYYHSFPLIRVLLSFYFCAHHISCTLPKKSLHHKQSDRRRETQKIQIQLSRKNSFGALTEANPTERKREPWWEQEGVRVKKRGRVKYDHIHNYWDHSFFISLLSPTLLNHHSASKWSKTNSLSDLELSLPPKRKKERKKKHSFFLHFHYSF